MNTYEMTREEAIKLKEPKMVLTLTKEAFDKGDNFVNSIYDTVFNLVKKRLPKRIYEGAKGIILNTRKDTASLAMSSCHVLEEVENTDIYNYIESFDLFNENNEFVGDFIHAG